MELKFTKRNQNPFSKWGTLIFNSQNSIIGQRLSQGSQSLCFFCLVQGCICVLWGGGKGMCTKKQTEKISDFLPQHKYDAILMLLLISRNHFLTLMI